MLFVHIGRPDSSDIDNARVSLKLLQNNMFKQAQKKKYSECRALQVPRHPSGLGHTLYTTRASVALKVSMKCMGPESRGEAKLAYVPWNARFRTMHTVTAS